MHFLKICGGSYKHDINLHLLNLSQFCQQHCKDECHNFAAQYQLFFFK